jgi:hypothetical protein
VNDAGDAGLDRQRRGSPVSDMLPAVAPYER